MAERKAVLLEDKLFGFPQRMSRCGKVCVLCGIRHYASIISMDTRETNYLCFGVDHLSLSLEQRPSYLLNQNFCDPLIYSTLASGFVSHKLTISADLDVFQAAPPVPTNTF